MGTPRGLGTAGRLARAAGAIRFSFTARDAGTKTEQPIDPPLRLETMINPSGYYLWFGRRVDGGPPPDPGVFRLRVEGDYYQPLELAALTRSGAGQSVRCVLEPGYAYPFAGGGLTAPGVAPTLLRGVLESYDGTGQAGADG